MADAGPPVIPIIPRTAYLTNVLLGTSVFLLVLAVLTLAMRVYAKTRIAKDVGWDDFFIVLGFMSAVADWALWVVIFYPAAGPNPVTFISMERLAYQLEITMYGIMFWGLSMMCIKISIALTLLRFLRSPAWRAFLYLMIGLQACLFIGNTLWLLLRCHPVSQSWEPIPAPGACTPDSASRTASTVTAAFNIATDFILSFMPLAFIIKLHRPVPEKILLSALMAVGLSVSVASILKTVVMQDFGAPGLDLLAVETALTTWTIAEQFMGVIAACLPSFNRPLLRALGPYFSISGSKGSRGPSRSFPHLGKISITTASKNTSNATGKGYIDSLSQPNGSEADIYHLNSFDNRNAPTVVATATGGLANSPTASMSAERQQGVDAESFVMDPKAIYYKTEIN